MILVFLTSRRISRHQVVYGGVRLHDESHCEMPDVGWDGFLLGHKVRSVRMVDHTVSTAHMSTSAGSMWERDGIVEKASARPKSDLTLQAELNDLKFNPPIEVGLPVFVGSESHLRPCRYQITVQMYVTEMAELPDVRLHHELVDAMFPLARSAKKRLRDDGADPIRVGLVQPVTIGNPPIHAVLHLVEALGNGIFRCQLYASDRSERIVPRGVLSREVCHDIQSRKVRYDKEIATILTVESSGEISPEATGSGIVRLKRNGGIFPIFCHECGTSFAPERFTPEQLQIIDMWGWLYPFEKERQILTRAQNFYRRHPKARGKITSKLGALLHSPKPFSGEGINTPLGEMRDPRPADYQKKLAAWTADDLELRNFFENTSCDVDNRLEFLNEKVAEWEKKLNGRCVMCPECHDGVIVLLTELKQRLSQRKSLS